MTGLKGLPVAGYTDQPPSKVDLVNVNKAIEERVLRNLDMLKQLSIEMAGHSPGSPPLLDGRWAAIAQTHFQEGFMALNRAIFQPARLTDEALAAIEAPPAAET